MPLVNERKVARQPIWLLLVVIVLTATLIAGAVWSCVVAPVRVPLGSHAVAFGQLYTVKRRPPAGHRPLGMVGNPNVTSRLYRVGDRLYFVAWK